MTWARAWLPFSIKSMAEGFQTVEKLQLPVTPPSKLRSTLI